MLLLPAILTGLLLSGATENVSGNLSSEMSVPSGQTPYMQYADSADIYISGNKWEAAESAILRALKEEPANPANPMLITNLGIVRNRLGHFREAAESFDIVLSRIPNSTVALTGRAESYIGLGQSAGALADLETAIAVDSTLTLPLTMHGYLLLRENRPAEAIGSFGRIIRLDSLDAIGHAGLADCLSALGRNEEAIAEYRQAVKTDDRPEWRFRAGLLLLDKDDIEGAYEQVRGALAKDPRHGETYILLALIHRKRFENSEAQTAEKMAREFGAPTELIDHYLGRR